MVNSGYPHDSYHMEDKIVRKLLIGFSAVLLTLSLVGNGLLLLSLSREAVRSAQSEQLLFETQDVLLRIAKANAAAQTELAAAKNGVGIKEALALWAHAPEVCSRISFQNLVGDRACVEAIQAHAQNRPFPTQHVELLILKDPQSAISAWPDFLKSRCALIEKQEEKPEICNTTG